MESEKKRIEKEVQNRVVAIKMSVSNGLCPRVVSTLQHVNENFEGDVVVHARKETKNTSKLGIR